MDATSSVVVPADIPSDKEFEAVIKKVEAMTLKQLDASLAIFRGSNPLPVCGACAKKEKTVKDCTVVDDPEAMHCSSCEGNKGGCSWSLEVRHIEAARKFPFLELAQVGEKYDEYRERNQARKSRKRGQPVQDETENGQASPPKRKRVTKCQGSSPDNNQATAAQPSSLSFASAYAGRPVTDIKLISGLDDLKDHKYNNMVREYHSMEESLKASFVHVEELQRNKLRLEVEIEMLKAQLKSSSAQAQD